MTLIVRHSLSASAVATGLEEIAEDTGVFDPPVHAERLLDGTLTRRGMWVRVMKERPPQPWHPIVSALGFTPNVGVSFRMAKHVEVSDQQDDMIRLVGPLLERIDGDAVLHFQFEEVWLLRKNGELSLNEKDDLWRPQRLALIAQPYSRESHTMDSD